MKPIANKQDLTCLQNSHALELAGDILSNSANYLILRVNTYSLE